MQRGELGSPLPSKLPFHCGMGKSHQHPSPAQPGCRRAELPMMLHPEDQGVTGVGYMPPTPIWRGQVGGGLAGGCGCRGGGSAAQMRKRQLPHHQHNSWSFPVSQ